MKCVLKEGFVWAQFTTGLSGIFTPGGKATGFHCCSSPRFSAAINQSECAVFLWFPATEFFATTVGSKA